MIDVEGVMPRARAGGAKQWLEHDAEPAENQHDANDQDDQLLIPESLATADIQDIGRQRQHDQAHAHADERDAGHPDRGAGAFGISHGNFLLDGRDWASAPNTWNASSGSQRSIQPGNSGASRCRKRPSTVMISV